MTPGLGHANYLAPKLARRANPQKHGHGIYALDDIAAGEVLAVFGGRVVDSAAVAAMAPRERFYVLQVEDQLFLAPVVDVDDAELINHSCEPNAGLSGQIGLVALRDIRRGEEVCFDYAMSDSSALTMDFECRCGTPSCRRRLHHEDWRRPDLQRRYRGFFSPYLQRRIDALRPVPLKLVGDETA